MELSAFDLSGKVALITGGAHGIGFSIAEGMAHCGAKVCFNCSSESSYEKGMAAYKAAGIDAHGYIADVTDWDAVKAMVDKIAAEVGPVDILVNNAGITRDATIKKMTPELWQEVIDVNLTGVFNCCKCVSAIMVEKGWGRILNASSVVGLYGNFGQTNYVATKAGIIGMTKTLAKELGRKGVTVNAVAPGFILTNMVRKMPTEVLDSMKAKVPEQRLGEPEEVAGLYAYLASDEAAYINGATISIDGGLTI